MGLVGAMVMAIGASPALAASQQVGVGDSSFLPGAVAVKRGESVTWTNPGTMEPHTVTFDDLRRISPFSRGPWTTEPFTFTTEGAYRYFCEEHGGPLGQGMSGIVYVTSTGELPPGPPAASLTVSTDSPRVGESITFNAEASSDPNGTIAKYEWDFDGNGFYETHTGTTPRVSQVYQTTGQQTVKLRVTDSDGLTGETDQRSFSVAAATPPPTPLVTSPAPVFPPAPPPATSGTQPAAQLPAVSSKIRLLSSRRLRNLLRRGLRFEAGVPSSGATLRATLSVRGRTLGTLWRANLARGRVKLTIKLSRRGKTSLKKLLANRKRTSAVVKVIAGNKTTRARVTLSR